MSNHRHGHVQKEHQTEHGCGTDEGGDESVGDTRRDCEKGERVVGERVLVEWVEREGRNGRFEGKTANSSEQSNGRESGWKERKENVEWKKWTGRESKRGRTGTQ
ncbi:hypothetical protein BLNAU_21290 [Blattamonas nauphoetae]|uniref:Uncharacterized protein n=1 Tax=Blattamonas nauphoetae TaxID=2049346 RepID=A0ABQ9WWC7_9EUKA|nr:hypothetical protein BLNAU_21290 [Blattamonas nauphoetae]